MKAIADTAHRLDQRIVARTRERPPQPAHVHVDRSLFHEGLVAPYFVEQLTAAERSLGMRHEKMQQAELGVAQLDIASISGHAPRGRLEFEAANRHGIVSEMRGAAPQYRFDARH